MLLMTCMLFLCLKTTTVLAGQTDDADITEVYENKDDTAVNISYVLESSKTMILRTSEKDVIDQTQLTEEIGAKNISVNADKDEFKLMLDDPKKIDFLLTITNKKPFKLSVLNASEELLFDHDFNQAKDGYVEEFGSAEDASWRQTDKLRLSQGPILDHTEGGKTVSYLYFGDFNYAQRKATIAESYSGKGGTAKKPKARLNSLTTPNSAVLYSSEGSTIESGPNGEGNHLYTSHYGDAQSFDTAPTTWAGEEQDKPYGSPNSFTSNTLFNYVKTTDKKERPGTSGPDRYGSSYAMSAMPKLYYRIDPETGYEEQKLVYTQQDFLVAKKGRDIHKLQITINHKFDKTGKTISTISYKNVGTTSLADFVGFSSHDISINKDGKEIEAINGKKIGNYMPMRSLGSERGMYLQSQNNEVRTSFYINSENGPDGWAGRSIGRSYLATKGFSKSDLLWIPGLQVASERYYPWKVGKKSNDSSFYDKKKKQYISPYVSRGLFNAFYDVKDRGDKGKNLPAGARLSADESTSYWDAGLTMRTKPQMLTPNQSVVLEFASQIDIMGLKFNPVLGLDQTGTNDNPFLIPAKNESFDLSGLWYDFDSTAERIFYTIDEENLDVDKAEILDGYHQTANEAVDGKVHEWKKNFSLRGLDDSKHTLRFWMQDNEENLSQVQTLVIKRIKNPENKPQIDIITPGSSDENPHSPMDHNLNIKGVWSDNDSKTIKSITYKIDDGEEKVLDQNIQNKKPGTTVPWKIENLDISEHNNFEKHKIEFTITDPKNNTDTDTFYYQHQGGSYQLFAPEEIDFGQTSLSSGSISPKKPTVQGDLLIDDFRDKDAPPLAVTLSIDTFYKEINDDNDDGDDEDDGDDGDGLHDGDNEKKALPKKVDKKESLSHDIFWKDQFVNDHDLLVGTTDTNQDGQWHRITNLTSNITKYLKLNFRSNETGSTPGKYTSVWTWNATDSL